MTTTQTMANVTSLSQALTRSLASTSSESDNEFMESCRPKSLLEDLEDDDELPDPDDDDDDENEDENEDDDLYDDVLVVSNDASEKGYKDYSRISFKIDTMAVIRTVLPRVS
ncbi:MAG: hypothetical protein AB2693_33350 [Candidatus Thiodiazotropha sp.]